jgi:hypothetical protein
MAGHARNKPASNLSERFSASRNNSYHVHVGMAARSRSAGWQRRLIYRHRPNYDALPLSKKEDGTYFRMVASRDFQIGETNMKRSIVGWTVIVLACLLGLALYRWEEHRHAMLVPSKHSVIRPTEAKPGESTPVETKPATH